MIGSSSELFGYYLSEVNCRTSRDGPQFHS